MVVLATLGPDSLAQTEDVFTSKSATRVWRTDPELKRQGLMLNYLFG
jgi:hypothetical protein